FFRCRWFSDMFCRYPSAVQTDAHRIPRIVQTRVVHFCRDNVLHRVSGGGIRNQSAHQQSCYGRVAIRKVKNVWFFFSLPYLSLRHSARGGFHSLAPRVPRTSTCLSLDAIEYLIIKVVI